MILNPKDPLAPFAVAQIDAAIKVYTSAVQSGSSSRLIRNLQWLIRLRRRASEELARPHEATQASGNEGSPNDPDEIELLGWRTRLIQRAARGTAHVATTIGGDTDISTSNFSPQTAIDDTLFQALQQHLNDAVFQTDLTQARAPTLGPTSAELAVSQTTATDTLVRHIIPDPSLQKISHTAPLFLGSNDAARFPRRREQCSGLSTSRCGPLTHSQTGGNCCRVDLTRP